MSAPHWSPIDEEVADLLTLVADPYTVAGADVPALFLAACRRDAMAHDGLVSVNRVRELLADEGIEHHRYSAQWAHQTGRDKPMVRAHDVDGEPLWEPCAGSRSGNNGRPYPVRRWVG